MHIFWLILQFILDAIGLFITGWSLWAFVACVDAHMNKRGLKPPTYVLGNLRHIARRDWSILWDKGVRTLIFDVDNTLCATYTTLPDWAIELIAYLHNQGFDIWLASKSNPNMARIEQQVHGHAHVYWPEEHDGIKKPSTEFFNFFMHSSDRVAFIGDKLTDMGREDMYNITWAESLLVNPIGKDLRGENSFMFRRVREWFTLRGWKIKRATFPNQFTVV